jgi:hypothetical protein
MKHPSESVVPISVDLQLGRQIRTRLFLEKGNIMLEALIHASIKFTNVSDSGQYNSEKATLDGKKKGATYSVISPNSMLSSSAASSGVAAFALQRLRTAASL